MSKTLSKRENGPLTFFPKEVRDLEKAFPKEVPDLDQDLKGSVWTPTFVDFFILNLEWELKAINESNVLKYHPTIYLRNHVRPFPNSSNVNQINLTAYAVKTDISTILGKG